MATPPPPPERSSRFRFRKRLLLLPLGLILIVALGAAFPSCLPFLSKKNDGPPVTSARAVRGEIIKTVSATGKVVPNFEVEIKAKASGKIVKLPYDVSDFVPRNALLVELDPIDESRNVNQESASLSALESKSAQSQVNLRVAERTLSTDIARARADLAAAQAKREDARNKARRLTALVKQRYISQEEAETGMTTEAQSETDLRNAQTRLNELKTSRLALQAQTEDVQYAVAQARAQQVALAKSQQRLSETRIYAPISGVVTSRAGQIGNIVASGVSNVGGGTAIMTLADLSHVYILANVDESDIGQVRLGQDVYITADAFPGRKFLGRVVRIAPQGIEESNVVTFETKIEVQDKNSRLLKLRMTTNVEIVAAKRADAVKVPVEAVQTGRHGRSFVLLPREEGPPERRPVETGLNNGTEVEIVQGLSAGETVITGQGLARSRWRKEQSVGGADSRGEGRRGQMMMMRGLGGGRR